MKYYVAEYLNGTFKLTRKPLKRSGIIRYWGPWKENRASWWLNQIKRGRVNVKPKKEFKT